jgi:type II secretory pathway component PulM
LGEIKSEAYNPASSYSTATGGSIQSTFNSAAASVSKAMPSSGDLQAQLDEAKAQIARLTQQAGEATGLRQRKTEPTRDSKQQLSAAMDTRQAPAGGVSVQITALLCLVSFLLAYFLFWAPPSIYLVQHGQYNTVRRRRLGPVERMKWGTW